MKRILSLLLIGCVLLGGLAGCANKTGAPEAESLESSDSETVSESETLTGQESEETTLTEALTDSHTVVDHRGQNVEVPNTISRVVIDQIPILSTYMSYFGGDAPYLVGFAGSFKTTISETVLKDIVPELLETADTVYAQSDLNIEEIIKLEPDVIFFNAANADHEQILEASGIPSVGFATIGEETGADPLELYAGWLRLLEDVFGEQGKMDEFVAAGDQIIEDVKSRIETVSEDKRPDVLILWKYSDGVAQVSGKGTFGQYWLEHLGVTDVAAGTGGFAQVSMEQIYEWDPDILFLDGPGLLPLRVSEVLENTVEGVDFSNMTAVQNERVYGTTLGMWNWFTPNPDVPIVFAWLACKTYPEAFADYPLEDTIRDYYKQWYGYEVDDAELAEMLEY
ncbi:MAG: ABC transporter substrate-binding protein [Fastidiosipilaceae bacterium]|jgi:iron complex transport system substrate-binding protein